MNSTLKSLRLLLILGIVVISSINFLDKNLIFETISPINFEYKQLDVYIYSATIAWHNLTRHHTSYKQWGRYVTKFYPKCNFNIWCDYKINATNDTNNNEVLISYPNPFKYHFVFNPVIIFYDSCYYLLKNTQNRWLLRVTDDVFVDVFELQKYITHLEKIYDPLKHIVIKGEQTEHYLHGGAGYLISRAAAEALIEFDKEFPLEASDIGDDYLLGEIFSMLQKGNMNTKSFASAVILAQSYEKLNKGISYLPNCSGTIVLSPGQIAVWHAGNRDMEVVANNNFYKKLPGNVYIEVLKGFRYFCIGNKENIIKSYEKEDNRPNFVTMKDVPDIIKANQGKIPMHPHEYQKFYMFNH